MRRWDLGARRGDGRWLWLFVALGLFALPACDARASGSEEAKRAELTAGLPALTGRVVDAANLLSDQAEAALTAKLAQLERRRTDQLVVVTLPSLQGSRIEDVGLRLGRGWGIGRRGKDNGVLLIVAPGERRVRIEVGYGLERAIENHEAARMIDGVMIPAFKAGDMDRGVVAGADAIIKELDRSPLVEAMR